MDFWGYVLALLVLQWRQNPDAFLERQKMVFSSYVFSVC